MARLSGGAMRGSTVPPRKQPIPLAEGSDPAGGMTFKRPILTLAMLGLSLAFGASLGACARFSDNVSDHWPHWAGGEPAGVPPRPGSPGYQEYIAHRQAQGAIPTPAPAAQAPAATGSAVAAQAPAAVQGSNPAAAGDAGAARGGLY